MEHDRTLTILLLPGSGGETRSLRISYRWLPLIASGAALLLLGLVFLFGSWWYLAARANEARLLEGRVAELVERESRVEALALTLQEVEEGYARIRDLFGADLLPPAQEIWLPPATGGSGGGSSTGEPTLPTSWPLTERGFVTQILLEGAGADHPGIDIAIPTGSYVRAAGGGTVIDAGEDPVYGSYLVLDHGGGYRTRYAHASLLLVDGGDRVVRNEVIALSGSSGRSTAPHLHFEIFLEGEPVDPLTMVTPP